MHYNQCSMQIGNDTTDAAVLSQLGVRVARIRLDRNLTQSQLAHEAGVHRNTVDRFESGQSVSLVNLVRILRVLELLPVLDALLPEPAPSPMEQLTMQGRQRRRARPPRGPQPSENEPQAWQWGDAEDDS